MWDWTPGIIEQWITEVRPAFGCADNLALWPSERADRVALRSTPASRGRIRRLPDTLSLQVVPVGWH
ncbi:MAG: hypothetical protein WCB57_05540 [Pseudonocardiaceae bacterium]